MRDNSISSPASHKAMTAPRLNRREVLAGGIALGALTLSGLQIVGGAFSPAFAEPKRGGVLKAAFSADPAGFDPVRGPSGMSHVVIEQVYSTLMALDPDAKPYPELAESYEVSDDGLQYTFKLRPGVTFHNGDELTAEDVKFSFDRLRAKDSGYSYGSQVETIASVDVVDKHTVSFRLSRRTGPFLVYMAFPGSSIVPKKLVESGHDLNATPVGSGPFKFVSYEPRSAIKFERNPHYFQEGKPYFDAMEYRIIPDVTALTNAVTSGEVNFSNEIPPKDWASVTTAPNLKTQNSRRVALLLASAEQHREAARQSESPPGDWPRTRSQGARRRRLLRPSHADSRRRHSRVELGPFGRQIFR